jgi:hypothetical protein
MEVRDMSFKWYFKLTGVVAVGALLALAEVQAQQPTISDGLTKSLQVSNKAKTASLPAALFLPNANQLTPLDQAYFDAFSILNEDNKCSAFYGGPPAIEALNRLREQLVLKHLDDTVVVRMIGETVKVINLRNRLTSYRLFDKAELNLDGPFYRVSPSHPHRIIGGFRPNTREARVTILLHELGHLIERPDKQWLLPNDGTDERLSDENTARVISVCGRQIRSLQTDQYRLPPFHFAARGNGTIFICLNSLLELI